MDGIKWYSVPLRRNLEVAINPAEPQPDATLSEFWQTLSAKARARAADGWLDMVHDLRTLQDEVAATIPPGDVVDSVTELLRQARALLAEHRLPAVERIYGQVLDAPGRGQTLAPPVRVVEWGPDRLTCETVFGPFHTGYAAAHGGAIALVFDEVFGRLADSSNRTPSRTVTLQLDYRSITPIDEPLLLEAVIDEEIERKRFLRGTLRHGDRICAEGRALFIAMRPEQTRVA